MDAGADRKTVRVTIFHQQYALAAVEDPEEVESLAREIDELMVSIAQHSTNADSTRIAVLACLHLADRLRVLERQLSGLKTRVDEKSRQLALLLDDASA